MYASYMNQPRGPHVCPYTIHTDHVCSGKEGSKVSDAISKAAEQLLYDQQLEEDVRQARLQRAQEEYDDLALVSR